MNFLIVIVMAAVLVVLLAGVGLMMRGGAANRKYGNKLMILRVSLQALAIGLIGMMFLFSHGASQ